MLSTNLTFSNVCAKFWIKIKLLSFIIVILLIGISLTSHIVQFALTSEDFRTFANITDESVNKINDTFMFYDPSKEE